MKRNIIPDLPQPFTVTEELEEKFNSWINHFKNLSPRIKVLKVSDQNFDLGKIETLVKEIIEFNHGVDFDDINLEHWPKKENIAFLVAYNSGLTGHPEQFLGKDTYIFCYGDLAFGLGYFERDSDSDNNDFILDYHESALSWNYIAKLIRDHILQIQVKIKSAKPPPPDEKLFENSKS